MSHGDGSGSEPGEITTPNNGCGGAVAFGVSSSFSLADSTTESLSDCSVAGCIV